MTVKSVNQKVDNVVLAQEYIQAMRHLAGAVSVITVTHEGERGGLTATSVASVAAEPAELLVCVNQSTDTWGLLERSRHFAVKVLTVDQVDVAERFAGVEIGRASCRGRRGGREVWGV